VKNDHQHSKDLNEIHLTQLADKDGFNILKLCAEEGDIKCVDILISLNIFQDDPSDIQNAQSRAQYYQHFDILLLLLKNNYTYPQYIREDLFPEDLKQFVKIFEDIHEAVKLKNFEQITRIIEEHPKIRHFYNKTNESVLKIALKLKFFDIYEHLLSHDLVLSPHENITRILAGFDDSDLTVLREIHFRCKKDLPESHMNTLMMNTSISHDDMEKEGKEKLVLRAYSVLNKDPQINPILKAVAASKRFIIVFDFKRTSVEVVDPTATDEMRGVFYLDRKICIGAKQLLDPSTEHETFGTLAHELCHYAMFLTFKNRAKPYQKSDHHIKEEYKKILKYCMENREKEEIISFAFGDNKHIYSAELIVRVVHLLAMYHNQPEKLQELREVYVLLFNYHSDVVLPAIKKAIPGIKSKADNELKEKDKKISNLSILLLVSIGLGIIIACLASLYFYKPVYKFSKLSDREKETVQSGLVWYKNETVMLNKLFPGKLDIFQHLTSDHISQLLKNEMLNFDDPQFHYLEEQIDLKWENLAENLREKFLDSYLNFQGKIVKLKDINNLYSEAFNALTSQQIIRLLSGNEFVIGEEFESEIKFYVERQFITEDAKLIRFEYEFGHEYVDIYDTRDEYIENRTKDKTLQELYDELLKKDFNEITQLFDKINENFVFKAAFYDLNHEAFHFMHKNSNVILEQADHEKILILSSEAGAGKTVTFEHFAIKMKTKFPLRWVSYLDLPKYTELYKSNRTAESLLKEIFELSPQKNNFEFRIFEECLKSGNLVLIWNAFDEISPTYNEFILNLIKYIHETYKNVQYVCTRPLYSDQLKKSFRIRTWQLIPFDNNKKQEFLRKFFDYENVSSVKVQEYIEKVEKIVEKLNYNDQFIYNFETPLMLRLIAEIHKNGDLFETLNIYGIFKAFVESKIELWLNKSKNTFSIAKKLLFSGSLKTIWQKFALLNEFSMFATSTLGLKMGKLQIMQKKIPIDFPIEEISQMGILFINGKNNFEFSHATLSEFFVAQFFIENIFDIDGSVDSDEAELRLELFYKVIQSYGIDQQIITDFMSSYLQGRKPQNPKKFNPIISKLIRTKFKKFFIRMLDTNYPKVFEFLFEFFKPDHDVLVDLLHVHEHETFYTAIFNPNYFTLFVDPEEIKSLAEKCLTDEEFQKFLTGKNQKGKILFGIYSYGFFGILKSIDAYSAEIDTFSGSSVWDFFPIMKYNLTVDEQKELFVATLNPKIYLYYEIMFSTVEYENLWTNFENLLTQHEMQDVIGDALVLYFEIFPSNKPRIEFFLNLLLEKAKKILTSSQIFEMFLNKSILHEAYWSGESFKVLWNFLRNQTNKEERRKILLQNDLDDKNFYFWTSFDELKKSFSRFKYNYFYYDFTPFKMFHRALTVPNSDKFYVTRDIYKEHFNNSEIREIIFGSNDFLYYVIGKAYDEPFKVFTSFLEELFEENEKQLLKKLFERKIDPTNLSVFELVDYYQGLPHFQTKWFNNLKTLSDLIK